jgi:thioredoxin-dependent peroxiredoxin
VILGVSFDGVDANAAFARKFGFPYPLLCDTDRKIGVAYGAAESSQAATARRISYIIGRDGRIAAAWPKVKPADHPAEVLAALS